MASDPKEMSRIHLKEAMKFFDNLFKVDTDLAECVQLMEVEEVRSFSALHEDPISDDQIELHIYACLVLAHKSHHAEPLEQVVEQTNMWIADVVQEQLEYVRRNQIRKKIIIVKNSYERMAEDSHFRDSVATDAVNQVLRDFYDRAKREYIMYERNGSLHHLNGAIEWATKIIDIPETYPGRAFFYYDLGYWLGKRYDRTWSLGDLNEAVKYAGLAVEFGGHDSEHQLQFHSSLGVRLRNRFMQTGVSQDIDKAIHSFELALAIIPPSHPHKPILMNSLGRSLGDRFLRTGSVVDLSRAVALADDVVQLAPRDHSVRPMFLHNLAEWLSRQFQQKGSVEDLNRAISASDLAFESTVEGYHGRGTILTGLATFLGQRFHQIGLSADIGEMQSTAI
jgi:tetratricopeptide (TPR) repeat protein